MNRDCFVIAIDGPAGAGKSTVARRVAEVRGLHYLDSGALYRGVGFAALEEGVDLDDAEGLARLTRRRRIVPSEQAGGILLDGKDVSEAIRSQDVSNAASKASRFAPVREALVSLQRAAVRPPGAVAEGRDMGTVIFPDANLKVFLDALPEERVRRRSAELGTRLQGPAYDRIRREMAQRDQRDSEREVAPLRPAEDALLIDSTALSIEQVVARIVDAARKRGRTN